MRAWLVVTVLLSAALTSACGGGDGGGMVACGAMTCGPTQTCNMGATPPVCRCKDAYTGPDCSSCARGYVMDGTTCKEAPIGCLTNPAVCGRGGICVTQPQRPDHCECRTGYTGRTCQVCASGYQDNDKNLTCSPTCQSTMLSCAAPQVCVDASGTARCECPPGTTGAGCAQCTAGAVRQPDGSCRVCPMNSTGPSCETCVAGTVRMADGSCRACPANTTGAMCEMCVAGFVRAPDGSCVQSCASRACGARRVCDESSGVPTCVCQAGHTGADCSMCAPGYAADMTGRCVMVAVPAGTTFIGAGNYQGSAYLLAINTSNDTATPLRPLPANQTQLAADAAGKVLYALSATGVGRLDLATGLVSPIASLASSQTLTFGAGALYSIPSLSPFLLKRIDPATGAVADLGPTGLANAQGLAFERPGALLVARQRTSSPGWGTELHRVDAASGAATALGAVPFEGMRLRPSDQRMALAVEPRTGRPFLVTRLGRTPEEIINAHCQQLAAGLGLSGYDRAPYFLLEHPQTGIGPGQTKVLTSGPGPAPELLAYASYGRSTAARATLRIETTNPNAFVCLSTYEEVLQLHVAATARFAGIVMAGYRPNLTLTVDTGFPATTRPTLHVFANVQTGIDPSVRAYAVSKVYTQAEWTQLRLPVYVSVWDADPMAPMRLIELDPASFAPVRAHVIMGIDLLALLAPWGG